MKKQQKKKNRSLFLIAAITLWSLIMAISFAAYAASYTAAAHENFSITVTSDGKAEVTKTATGWSINAYGKTDSGCTGDTLSTVSVTVRITNTATKTDGSIRGATCKITTTGMKTNSTAATKSFDATTTYCEYTATSGNGANNSTSLTVSISDIVLESLGTTVNTHIKTVANAEISVDGTKIEADTTFSNTDDKTYTLVATPAQGYAVFGWMLDDSYLDTSGKTTISYAASEEHTVQPVIIRAGSAMYRILNASPVVYYEYFDKALDAAGTSGTVVVHQSGTLYGSTGQTSFTIEKDQKLLVPFSDADEGYFGAIPDNSGSVITAASTFRTLTVPAGTSIICNGQINVNGQWRNDSQGNNGTGVAKGKHGQLILAGSGTQLTINSTGALYAYGFVSGTGGVTMNGGELRELMQVYDWAGGSNTSGWYGSLGSKKAQTLFFSAHYYVQNVEAPLTVNYGSQMIIETALSLSNKLYRSSPHIVGTDKGLFKLGEGTHLVRTYDPSTDRVEWALGGSGNINFGSISVSVTIIMNVDMNSSEFTLPLNNAMTVRIGDGVTMNMGNRVALMPGSQVIVDEGGVLNLTNHAYIFDKADKTENLFYQGRIAPEYTAGRGTSARITELTESGHLEVNGTLNLTGNGAIYTTTSGSNEDKIVYGTGTINHMGTLGQAALRGGYTSSYVTISVGNGLTHLAGHDGMTAFSSDTTNGITYHGLGAGHNNNWYISSEPVDATCTVDAHTRYYGTSDTSKYYAIYDEGTALGHDEISHEAQAPTCTEIGWDAYVTCSRCSYTTYVEKAALGHTYGKPVFTWAEDHSTCSASVTCDICADNTEGKTLSGNCDVTSVTTDATCSKEGSIVYTAKITLNEDYTDTYTKILNIDKTNHTYESEVTAPTCTEQGYTTRTCKDCNNTEKADFVDALGHTWVAATCTAPKSCSVCGTTEGEALGHTPGVEATCTTAQTCTVCGTELAAALGHTWTDATCTDPKTCSVCGATEGEADASAHQWGEWTTVTVATCTTKGQQKRECVLDATHIETQEIAMVSHSMTHHPAVDATCVAVGNVEYWSCSACKLNYSDQAGTTKLDTVEISVNPDAHDLKEVAAQAATCTQIGWDAYQKCQREGCAYSTYVEIPALEHKDDNKDHACDNGCDVYQGTHADSATDKDHACDYCNGVVEGDVCVDENNDHKCDECTETTSNCVDVDKDHECDYSGCKAVMGEHKNGTNTHICEYCGKAASSCEYTEQGKLLTEANCVTKAVYEAQCAVCGSVNGVIEGTVDSSKHAELQKVGAQAPTCTEAGFEDYEYCTKCGYTTFKAVDATGHDYEAVVTDPTCVEDGYTTYTCSNCGDDYRGDNVAALGHTWVAATCTDPKTCSVCGETEGDPLDHSWTVTYAWAQESDGWYCTATHVCGRDSGHNQTEKVKGTGSVTIPATCISMGTTTYTAAFNADWAVDGQPNTVQDVAVNPNNHTSTEFTWSQTETQHSAVHKCCNTSAVATEVHEWTEGVCSECSYICVHADGDDANHTCDYCQKAVEGDVCTDANNDHKCDECTAEMNMDQHKDADNDDNHVCDYGCGAVLEECSDVTGDGNHNCDICGESYGSCTPSTEWSKDETHHWYDCTECGADSSKAEHADTDNNHLCDTCSYEISTCVDIDKNHDCDLTGCANQMGTCADYDEDHYCDYGAGTEGGCTDYFGTHADGDDTNHLCDYCQKAVEGDVCTDADKNHKCDECEDEMGKHEDTNNDHVCEYGCSEAIGTHADSATDKDHVCDYGCGAVLEECIDSDKDHICDNGCDKVYGTCEDKDLDHNCDYGCDKGYGEHADADKNHTCDYGCSVTIGTCEDADQDHDCDYGCDKYFGQHTDTDKDHACDYGCSVEDFGAHEDKDSNHTCDYGCIEIIGEHKDSPDDTDHICDYCKDSADVLESCTSGAVQKENEKAATCTAKGSYDNVVYCSVCNKELSRNTVTVEKIAHAYDAVVTAPTCTAKGYTTYTCSACGDSYVDDEVAAKGHTEGEAVEENNVAPDFDAEGHYDTVVYCSVCNAELSRVTTTIPALVAVAEVDGTKYESITEAVTKAQTGDVVILLKDTIVTDSVVIDKNITLNLNGKTLSAANTLSSKPVIRVLAEVTVKGGIVDGTTGTNSYAFIVGNSDTTGELTITDGTYKGVTSVISITKGTANISGGHFATGHDDEGTDYGSKYLLNCMDAAYKAGEAKYIITGGEFVGFNPMNNEAEGKNTNFLDDSRHAVDDDKDGIYTIGLHNVTIDTAVAPTCTETGLTEGKHCDICGEVLLAQEVVAALGHTPGETVVENKKAATCTKEGSYDNVVYCTVCDKELSRDTVKVEKIAHTAAEAVKENEKSSSCAVAGSYDEVVYCSICNTELSRETKALELAAHTEGAVVVENEVDATCTKEGSYDNVVYCSVCNAELSRDTVTVEKLPHTPGDVTVENNVPADCENAGSYDQVVYCTACTAEISRNTVTVDALNHQEVVDEAVAPTCTATGLTEGKHCSVCGKVLVAQETVAALGHTEVIDEAVASTCIATGLTEGKHCTVCGIVTVAQTVVEKIAHNYETVVTPPTCTEAGYTTYTCSACGDTHTGDPVDNLGHTAVTDAAVAPTCTETGLTEGSHCSVCKVVLVAQETVAALGHAPVTDAAVAPTCTATGLTEGKHCDVCGQILVAQETVPVVSHSYDDGVVTKEATCDAAGEKTYTCSACGQSYTEPVAPLGHKSVTDAAVAPSCTETGLTEGSHCGICGAVLTAQQEVAALGHKYNSTVTAPGCTTGGYTTYVCSVCGDTYIADETEPAGHKWEAGICTVCKLECKHEAYDPEKQICKVCGIDCDHKEYDSVETKPNCTQAGQITKTCSACGHVWTDAGEAATGHQWQDATCTTPKACKNCPATEGKPLNHSYTDEVTAPTCTVDGYTTHTCSRCGHSYKDTTVTAPGHTEGDIKEENIKDVTCTEDGSYYKISYCRTCQEETGRETITVASTGHKYGSVVTAPTCTEDGYTTYTCSVCNDSYTGDTVEKLNHNEVIDAAVEATCTTDGKTEGKHCDRCGEVLVAQQTITAVGHDYKDTVTAPTCTAQGYTTYTCTACSHSYVDSYTETIPHSGGEATCKDYAVCDTCGKEYGELSKEHTPGAEATCTEPQICTVCETELAPEKGHQWVDATYTAPKTCSVCGEKDGEPLVDIVGSYDGKEADVNSTLSAVVGSTKTVQPLDHGIEAGANKQVVEEAKTQMAASRYETLLKIVLKTVTMGAEELVEKFTYDVTPMLLALNESGEEVDRKELNEFEEEITFRLPVDKNTKFTRARVWHEEEPLEPREILTDDQGNKYVEVKATKFSKYSVQPIAECAEHQFENSVCTVCGVVCGHSWTDGTCTECGTVCEHTYVDGVCTNCGAKEPKELFELAGANMTLGNSLDINFFINPSDLIEGETYYAVLTKEYADSRGSVAKTVDQTNWTWSTRFNLYYVSFGVAAKEMTDEIHVVIYNSMGEAVSYEWTDSVRNYAMRMLPKEEAKADPDPEKLALYVDMLNYGAAAQIYFQHYHSDDLANSQLSDQQKAYATASVTMEDHRIIDEAYSGSNLTLESEIEMNFFFLGSHVDQSMYAIAEFVNHYGEQKTIRVEGTNFGQWEGDSRWYVPVTEMVVSDCKELVTVTVYNSDDVIVSSVVDSIESYIARKATRDPLYETIMKFATSAYAYFH